MKQEDKNELIINAASKVHEAWCEGELRAFYNRFVEALKTEKTPGLALGKACYKGDRKRNEAEVLDADFLSSHPAFVSRHLETFEGFKHLINKGWLAVKRFTKRSVTKEEQERLGDDYNKETQEENILKPFYDLSADSQKENLQAAMGAAYVYEEYMKRGATLEQFETEEAKKAVGTLIHASWMSRNERTETNKHLFIPYSELDDWTKQQDLDVFNALLEEVKKNPEKYAVEKEEGKFALCPEARETQILDEKIPERAYEAWRESTQLRF